MGPQVFSTEKAQTHRITATHIPLVLLPLCQISSYIYDSCTRLEGLLSSQIRQRTSGRITNNTARTLPRVSEVLLLIKLINYPFSISSMSLQG